MAATVGNADVQLTNAPAAIITTGPSDQFTILKASVCNTDAATHSVNVWRVPNAGAPGSANQLINTLAIGAGQTVVLPLSGQTVLQGQTLQADADASGDVTMSVSWISQP